MIALLRVLLLAESFRIIYTETNNLLILSESEAILLKYSSCAFPKPEELR